MAGLFSGVKFYCTMCNSAMGACDCWETCSCWITNLRGEFCRNPETTRCSSKLKYGKYNRKTKRYEPNPS